MSKLKEMVAMEYAMDVKTKSFWISTFLLPVLMAGFGLLVGFLTEDSDAMKLFSETTAPTPDKDITGMQALGMVSGVLLVMFVMIYGSQIFNKVKSEKCNRIVEVLVSCVSGRTIMLSKVISVALTGFTQILIWLACLVGIAAFVLAVAPIDIPFSALFQWKVGYALLISILYFFGGYFFYASLFAAAGALTDRNNENQGYLSMLVMILMVSFYIGIYATDAPGAPLAMVCLYLPFTSPSVGAVQTIGGIIPWWQTLISLSILYVGAFVSTIVAGKIYTSAVLLKGSKFTPKDILVFIKAK